MQEEDAPRNIDRKADAGGPVEADVRTPEVVIQCALLHVLHDEGHGANAHPQHAYDVGITEPGHEPHLAAELLKEFGSLLVGLEDRPKRPHLLHGDVLASVAGHVDGALLVLREVLHVLEILVVNADVVQGPQGYVGSEVVDGYGVLFALHHRLPLLHRRLEVLQAERAGLGVAQGEAVDARNVDVDCHVQPLSNNIFNAHYQREQQLMALVATDVHPQNVLRHLEVHQADVLIFGE
mmetsp:Transcript_868/g.2243  ORF Transcript_868/g.2243 Transcript_868/m.2243 type:complete len:237 (-) Transcript_868:1748-2458(-)